MRHPNESAEIYGTQQSFPESDSPISSCGLAKFRRLGLGLGLKSVGIGG